MVTPADRSTDFVDDLFGSLAKEPPIVRRTDPYTSKQSAKAYTASGRRRSDKLLVLEMVQRRPGHTAAEYSDLLRIDGMDWYAAAQMPTKRLADLVEAGKIVRSKPRTCRKTGKRRHTYYPV